jgi:predicted amidohydrolase YtcJ
MKLKNIRLLILLLPLSVLFASVNAQAQPADVLFFGDNIITVDENIANAEAVAVKGDRIIFVGTRAAAANHQGTATKVVELGQQALLPGFIDSHGHVGTQGKLLQLANLSSPPVGSVGKLEDLDQALRQHIAANKLSAGEWVVGFGYDDSLLAEGRHPNRDELDAVSTQHPILVMHVSGHLGAVNSRALELLGISAETENPPGGVIRRREGSSEPNGVLEEKAVMQVNMSLPQPSLDESVEMLVAVQSYYASKGITTVQESGAMPTDLAVFQAAAGQQKLFLDLVAYPFWLADKADMPEPGKFGEYQQRFKLGGIKIVLDGSPQGKTAYLSEPYVVPPPGQSADYRGYPIMPQETVDQAVKAVLGKGIHLLAHANGDAAAEMLIDAVTLAVEQLSVTDTRVVMIHAQTVRDDQLDRMASLGMIPSFFPAHTFFWGDWHRESVLGAVRADRISPTRSALDRGIPFTIHNDAPVTPPIPIDLMWSTVNRRTRSDDILGPAQRVDAYQAIKALTLNAAHQYFEESSKGSITPGKLADLVILSANPITMEPEQLRDIQVISTWSHGVQVYSANDP